MTLKDRDAAEVEDDLDSTEALVQRAVYRATRRWLARLNAALRAGLAQGTAPSALVAAAAPVPQDPDDVMPVTLGEATRWWAEEVNSTVALAVREAWVRSYLATREGTILESSLQGLDLYVAAVSDRLVRGIEPPLPDEAMNRVRVALATSIGEGWSTEQLAQRIAADLSWEKRGAYWRERKQAAAAAIDAILDPLGPPGTPARETARLSDPQVQAYRDEMNTATRALDAEQSYWNTRATRIARTESTGAYNAAGVTALADEGVEFKEWMATHDARTRPDHLAADGQVVGINQPFIVGGSALMYPGAPGGPASEVVNCRCTMIGRRRDEVPADVASAVPAPALPSPDIGPGGRAR